MELIISILIFLGAISSSDEYTQQTYDDNQAAVEEYIAEKTEAGVVGVDELEF